MLPDDMFVSRLIDFAILCDGDPQNASIELLRRSDPFGQSEGSRWYEGRPLEELNLVNFWQRLKDKESFGLGSAPGRVANAVQERLSVAIWLNECPMPSSRSLATKPLTSKSCSTFG